MLDKLKLTPITVLDDYQVMVRDNNEVVLTTIVGEGVLNPYGKAHGGYSFTLADSVAGLTTVVLGSYSVTLQSNIHYMAAVELGDQLEVVGRCVHNGSRTKVIDVTIHNQEHTLLAQASFTMFVTGKVE